MDFKTRGWDLGGSGHHGFYCVASLQGASGDNDTIIRAINLPKNCSGLVFEAESWSEVTTVKSGGIQMEASFVKPGMSTHNTSKGGHGRFCCHPTNARVTHVLLTNKLNDPCVHAELFDDVLSDLFSVPGPAAAADPPLRAPEEEVRVACPPPQVTVGLVPASEANISEEEVRVACPPPRVTVGLAPTSKANFPFVAMKSETAVIPRPPPRTTLESFQGLSWGCNLRKDRKAIHNACDVNVDLSNMARGKWGCSEGEEIADLGHLKRESGLHHATRKLMLHNPEYFETLRKVLSILLRTDRRVVQVSANCTWGKHRSVAFIEDLAKMLPPYVECSIIHMERPRWDKVYKRHVGAEFVPFPIPMWEEKWKTIVSRCGVELAFLKVR